MIPRRHHGSSRRVLATTPTTTTNELEGLGYDQLHRPGPHFGHLAQDNGLCDPVTRVGLAEDGSLVEHVHGLLEACSQQGWLFGPCETVS